MENLNEQIHRIRKMIGINESFMISSNLKLGSSNDNVKELQNLLKIPVSGEFDETTKSCVEQFQDSTDIKVDGIVGPETTNKLNQLIDNKIQFEGCKTPKDVEIKQDIEKTQTPTTSQAQEIDYTKIKVDQSKITGNSWSSCKMWKGKGGLSGNSDKVSVSSSNQAFSITYNGPASGLAIAHGGNGKDTIHQLYNILICEMNPFLAQGGMKPDIDNITFDTGSDGKNSKLTIKIPLTPTNKIYQIDRRGGWGHDPGSMKMKNKCKNIVKDGKDCYGPVKTVAKGPFGKITEYFITYEI